MTTSTATVARSAFLNSYTPALRGGSLRLGQPLPCAVCHRAAARVFVYCGVETAAELWVCVHCDEEWERVHRD